MSVGAAPVLQDEEARRLIREEIGESLFVEASAGTGKTTELIRRMVKVLASGAGTIDRLVAVTFTHKAAGELKLRLRQELDRSRAQATDSAERRNLEAALERLEEAWIGTIHSFCAQILRQRPVEARVDPSFEELTEREASRIFGREFRAWLRDALERGLPGVRRALLRAAREQGEESPASALERAARTLVEWRDFPEPWRRPAFPRQEMAATLVEQALELANWSEGCPNPKDYLYRALAPARDFAAWWDRYQAGGLPDPDLLEDQLLHLRKGLAADRRKGYGFFAEDLPRPKVIDARDRLLAALEGFGAKSEADLAAELRDELWPLVERYDAAKRAAGKLDFLDLLIYARDLVRDNEIVRNYLQQRFRHLFIDEFQDTDPIQAELLLLLSASNPEETDWQAVRPAAGKLFVVGDPKQSIYKFRRADVLLYEQIRTNLSERGVRVVYLRRSFRAVRPIQHLVNASFAVEMRGNPRTGQAKYEPLEEHWPAHPGQPAIVVLPVGRPYGYRNLSRKNFSACEPRAVVGFVRWLLRESGWRVRDPANPATTVPVAPRHVAILFRRFVQYRQDVTREYIRGFESLNIDHLLIGSKSYHQREEVETMRVALAAIEYPDDELSIYATLRGPLFAILDATLLVWRRRFGRLHPLRPPPDGSGEGDFAPVADALEILRNLHRSRHYRPVAETVARLLHAVRAHATFALRPAGHQVLANLSRVSDLARNYEIEGGRSFRGFVEELETLADKGFTSEAPVVEEASEGVRLMTVHTAKGLEFPVVILADSMARQAQRTPERVVDPLRGLCATTLLRARPAELQENEAVEYERELAEGARVAYVAATRAKDLLVVTACGEEPMEGWISPLFRGIYPEPLNHRVRQQASGCPSFGSATVLYRPPAIASPEEYSIHPGAHRPQAGEHEVVWWDPALIDQELDPAMGLRHEEILKPLDDPPPSLIRYRRWEAERAGTLLKGSAAAFQAFSATQAAEAPAGFPEGTVSMESSRPPRAKSGKRFGALVHAVLSDIALAASAEQVRMAVEWQARVFGADEAESRAATEAVIAALAHRVIGRARQAHRVVREMPVLLHLDNQQIFEGIIDLAFEEEHGWTVVDYKTDADVEIYRAEYEKQVAWYVYAVEKLEGKPARGILLRV